jgi:hypothetical protein
MQVSHYKICKKSCSHIKIGVLLYGVVCRVLVMQPVTMCVWIVYKQWIIFGNLLLHLGPFSMRWYVVLCVWGLVILNCMYMSGRVHFPWWILGPCEVASRPCSVVILNCMGTSRQVHKHDRSLDHVKVHLGHVVWGVMVRRALVMQPVIMCAWIVYKQWIIFGHLLLHLGHVVWGDMWCLDEYSSHDGS